MKRILVLGVFTLLIAGAALAAPVSGAIFTTDSSCGGTNVNIFTSKDDVYLDGGPAHPHAAGLPDGLYYVQVTVPDGSVLGTSPSANVSVSAGEFAQCYQLSAILNRASDSTPGYDDTTNAGGEYKVWVSQDPSFANNASKTDNFKVKPEQVENPQGELIVHKFYDANANGVWDAGDTEIVGWNITIQDEVHAWIDWQKTTNVDMWVDPGQYSVTEGTATQMNWRATTATNQTFTLANNTTHVVDFGNLCLGGGGGLTLGFWSNKNGEKEVDGGDMAALVASNLRNSDGTNFDPPNYKAFRTWILSANATNMACMLSAQYAAMKLNVLNGHVSASAIIYAPGTPSANALGYATVGTTLFDANDALGMNGYTVASGIDRTTQEALKNALDRANNNLNFVQAGPCPFSF